MMGVVRKRIREDSGVAMITVLGVIAIITVLAVGSYAIASQSLHETRRVESESKAFRTANTGLERVLASFSEQSITNGSFPLVGSTPDGTYTVTIQDIDPGYGEYRLTSVGIGRDGTSETVAQHFYYMNLWKMNFAGTGDQTLISGSGGLKGSSNIVGPFYMKGNLAIGANMKVLEGPLFVKNGSITVASSGQLGTSTQYVRVFCDGNVPPNDTKGGAGGVFVSQVSRSVPDITLPSISQGQLEQWATKAQAESVDNIMGPVDRSTAVNLECVNGDPNTYTTMQPPNSGTTVRQYADTRAGRHACYKFIGNSNGTISAKGQGTYGLTIGGRSFGAWGSLTTTGTNLTTTWTTYTANRHDDFAYDNTRKILFVEGTVFVDGPVTFNEDMYYIGNGTIVANGNITINGTLRPYGSTTADGSGNYNWIGEQNKWALGLATPGNIIVATQDSNPLGGNSALEQARKASPTGAGAFYAEGVVTFQHNVLMRGSVIAGRIDSAHPNMCLVTNPLLPTYLPQSLPGVDTGLLMPGLWTRR
ncbi:MAG: hypothetical protein N3B11_05100 [Coriobacteriia bacterium]|nr:hypothetical protein [Coriobacteriia bacterium]